MLLAEINTDGVKCPEEIFRVNQKWTAALQQSHFDVGITLSKEVPKCITLLLDNFVMK